MAKINAGCVVVTKFCGSGSAEFGSYIDYIDRDQAVRNEYISTYNLYNDYMSNPVKTTGLFSKGKEELNIGEIQHIKSTFMAAQENGSLMWQTVISFDNRWLHENGIYDKETNFFDESRIKKIVSAGVDKMLSCENLQNAVWSAAIHYNTDNIHVHIATVEPIPMREIKTFKKYEYINDSSGNYIQDRYGKWVYVKDETLEKKEAEGKALERYRKEPVLDAFGNQEYVEEYVGVFKQKSIETCKSYVVNEIISEKSNTIEINNIIRNVMVHSKKQHDIHKDNEFVDKFLSLHNDLLEIGSKKKWNYRSPEVENLKTKIDELSLMYLKKYQKNEYREYQKLVSRQSELYEEAYGDNKEARSYKKSKDEDLLYRMGNAILRECRQFEKSKFQEIQSNENTEQFDNSNEESGRNNGFNFYKKGALSELYYEGKDLLKEGKLDEAFDRFDQAASFDKFIAAKYQKARLYNNRDFSMYDPEKAILLFKECAEQDFQAANYRLAQIYMNPANDKYDYYKGFSYLTESADNGFLAAQYKMATILMNENCEQYNFEKGFQYLTDSAQKKWGPSQYKLSNILLDKNSTYYNYEEGLKNLKGSSDKGFAPAQYKLGCIYVDSENKAYNLKKGVKLLEKCVQKNDFEQAKYKLANIYMNKESGMYNPEKGIKYLIECSENNNQFAQVKLGNIYSDSNNKYPGVKKDPVKALKYYSMAAKNGNTYAEYKINRLQKTNTIKRRHTSSSKHSRQLMRKNYEIEKGLNALQRSFEKEVNKQRNIREYERLNKLSRATQLDKENELEY